MQASIIEVRAGNDTAAFWVFKPSPTDWLRFPVMQHQGCAAPLLRVISRMDRDSLIVFDLDTGRGGVFHPSESAHTTLAQSDIDVGPLFEPFVNWLLAWSRDNGLEALPQTLELAAAAASSR